EDEANLERGPLRPRKLRGGRLRDSVEIGLGFFLADAGAQASHHAQMMAPLRGVNVGDVRWVVLFGRPNLRRRGENIFEAAGHRTDDGIRVTIENDLLADDRAIAAEAPLPKPVAEDGHFPAVICVVGWVKIAAHRSRNAEYAE